MVFKFRKLFFFLVCFFSFMTFADAAICSRATFNKLEEEAKNVKISYVLKKDYLYAEYEVTISNLTENIKINYGSMEYTYDSKRTDPSSAVVINAFDLGASYSFEIYATSKTGCAGNLIYTKNVTFPHYNVYYDLDECIGYEDFPMCQKNYKKEIASYEYFMEELEKYKQSLIVEEEPTVVKDKTNWEKFVELYKENLIISIPVTIVIALVIVSIPVIIIKRRKRVKIEGLR